jgi:magnesium chelatase family protein
MEYPQSPLAQAWAFVLVAAINPCPCGYFGDSEKQCTCTMAMVQKYQKRISGPVLDRIDIHLDVPRVPMQKLASLDGGEPSTSIRQRVEKAREIQQARFAQLRKPNVQVNGDMGPAEVQKFWQPDKSGLAMIRMAVKRIELSVRAYRSLLKLSRTKVLLAHISINYWERSPNPNQNRRP